MKFKNIVFVGAARSPIGKYLGYLKDIKIQDLGVLTLNQAIKRAKIDKKDIDEIIVGNVISSPNVANIAQIIGIDMDLKDVTGLTVNRICGSGMQSAINGYQELIFGKKQVVAVGGIESMSRSPYLLSENIRYEGMKSGDMEIIDGNMACLKSASGTYSGIDNMGQTAENIAKKYDISRQDQDKFSYESHVKALSSTKSGRLKQEYFTIDTKEGQIDNDHQIRPNSSLEKLSKLKPVFEENGSVTAGNSSAFNDGASFEIMTTEDYALNNNLEIMGYFVDYAIEGVDPAYMGMGPVKAIQKICKDNELDLLNDVDILEINEAFSAQVLACLKELGIALDSDYYKNNFNINGGAIALGHPLGMSGARLITTALYEFKNNPSKKYAIISACIGGGQGIAMLLKNGYYKD